MFTKSNSWGVSSQIAAYIAWVGFVAKACSWTAFVKLGCDTGVRDRFNMASGTWVRLKGMGCAGRWGREVPLWCSQMEIGVLRLVKPLQQGARCASASFP